MFTTKEKIHVSQFVHDGWERLFLLGPLVSVAISEATKQGWEWVRSERDHVMELPTVVQPTPFVEYASGNVLAELRRPVTKDTKSPRVCPSGFLMD